MLDKSYDLVVIGAGPAGLMATISALEFCKKTRPDKHFNVVILEKMPKPGLKLLASGGGRCNISNTLNSDAMARRFGDANSFVKRALSKFSSDELRSWFANIGVETHAPDGFHVFPTDHSARSVQQALLRRADKLGLQVQLDSEVKGLRIDAGQINGVQLKNGLELKCSAVIVATGGRGFADLGGGRSGFSLAEQTGHKITELFAGMLPLDTKEAWPARCTAHTLGKAVLRIPAPEGQNKWPNLEVQGDVIFTKTGLAGPLILDVAAEISQRLRAQGEVPVLLSPGPIQDEELWLDKMAQSQGRTTPQTCATWIQAQKIPKPLAQVICEQAGISPRHPLDSLALEQQKKLANKLCWLPLTITGHAGFTKAMVTRGGVSRKQVDRKTLASRVVTGLYFAGEALDVDGPCGGYNLHWAFASGRMAGLSAGRFVNDYIK